MGRMNDLLIDLQEEVESIDNINDLLLLMYELEQHGASGYEIQLVKDKLSFLIG